MPNNAQSKKKRTQFTEEQLAILGGYLQKNLQINCTLKFPDANIMQQFCDDLDLSKTQISQWFHRARRKVNDEKRKAWCLHALGFVGSEKPPTVTARKSKPSVRPTTPVQKPKKSKSPDDIVVKDEEIVQPQPVLKRKTNADSNSAKKKRRKTNNNNNIKNNNKRRYNNNHEVLISQEQLQLLFDAKKEMHQTGEKYDIDLLEIDTGLSADRIHKWFNKFSTCKITEQEKSYGVNYILNNFLTKFMCSYKQSNNQDPYDLFGIDKFEKENPVMFELLNQCFDDLEVEKMELKDRIMEYHKAHKTFDKPHETNIENN